MSVTISGGDQVGITVESDPTALKIANNLSDVTDIAAAKANLGITSGGGITVDIQTFGSSTAGGNFTWTKPANAKIVEVYLWGAGAGGGSGARQASTGGRGGASGGGAGGIGVFRFLASDLGATVPITIPLGTSGAASVLVDQTFGTAAVAPSDAFFGTCRTKSGNPGAGGSNSTASSQSGGSNRFFFADGGSGNSGGGTNSTGGNAGNSSAPTFGVGCTGGGGGAGAAANSTTSTAGGKAADIGVVVGGTGLNVSFLGGLGGTTTGVAATNGVRSTAPSVTLGGGTGGGGGFFINNAAGGNGGNGAWPGGGGGGGGASTNGFASGAGGSGANGYCVVISYI